MSTGNSGGDRGNGSQEPAAPPSRGETAADRDPNGLYQKGALVARIREAEIDEAGKEVRFTEIYQSDDLLLPEECEFREFILVVRRVTYATRETTPERARILRGVVAEIVGRRNN